MSSGICANPTFIYRVRGQLIAGVTANTYSAIAARSVIIQSAVDGERREDQHISQ